MSKVTHFFSVRAEDEVEAKFTASEEFYGHNGIIQAVYSCEHDMCTKIAKEMKAFVEMKFDEVENILAEFEHIYGKLPCKNISVVDYWKMEKACHWMREYLGNDWDSSVFDWEFFSQDYTEYGITNIEGKGQSFIVQVQIEY